MADDAPSSSLRPAPRNSLHVQDRAYSFYLETSRLSPNLPKERWSNYLAGQVEMIDGIPVTLDIASGSLLVDS